MRVSGGHIPLTAIILTLNEADNIRDCLAGLTRIADVVILDSGSTDGTIEIARRMRPDIRVFEHPFKDFGEQRTFAIKTCAGAHEWILFVDADEYCTDVFLDEVQAFLASPGANVGAYVAGKNYFLGRWLRYSTLYPSYQLRLLRRDRVHFVKEGHGQREVADGPLHYLSEGWRHEGFRKGVAQWIDRHNRYSTEEVELHRRLEREPLSAGEFFSRNAIERRRAVKRLSARLPLRPVLLFFYLYVWKRGFIDGYPGFLYCAMVSANMVYIVAKRAEARYMGRAGSAP
jgi:glycosyltransferase involved in cell wall biosynthesis